MLEEAEQAGDGTEAETLEVKQVNAGLANKVVIASSTSGTYYGSQEDLDRLNAAIAADDMNTVKSIFDKYGVPYAK